MAESRLVAAVKNLTLTVDSFRLDEQFIFIFLKMHVINVWIFIIISSADCMFRCMLNLCEDWMVCDLWLMTILYLNIKCCSTSYF
jgi:hypothetical protein